MTSFVHPVEIENYKIIALRYAPKIFALIILVWHKATLILYFVMIGIDIY